ncbi:MULTISPECIES: DASS family sodium-coupled anion symporter [Corynebacterium]|uniref:DASS family sodium-coupled anion symporter n=1 Tax=Corynebacterium TaxID=1716 RepID=UPI000AF12E2D|nr:MULTISPECIES: DASS family sodium-coupled anion symporter [Corynebacterium]MDK8306505.1 DASS family sodium-coupled anion symporter [Corynebacterium imitans]MDK8637474.1 DASS family sodium-coupled anion symporter [Corynebacterium imitans]MDK8772627.1 DASS family sodium-coupled anion symporter [Corynebacterium imitans]
MTTAATAHEEKEASRSKVKIISFFLAFVALAAVLLVPIEGIEWQGQIALGMLAFAVIMWVTEAVSYPVSSVLIISLISLLVGLSPDPETPGEVFGTGPALSMALSGFSSGAVALVAAALALATAMQATGLHRRIALYVLKIAGEKTSRIVAGAIIISIILAFFVPSATARAGAVVPILLGMVAAFGLAVDSKLSALLVITAVQAVSIWNVGIKTAAAQNLVAIGFIEDQMGQTVSWGQWFLWAAPWSVLMSIALYFIMRAAIKPEVDHIEGGRALVEKQLAEMGPMTGAEKRLTAIAVVLLCFWATEGFLHPINSSTITVAAIALMLLPGIGVMDFKYAQDNINWGTLIVFAVGISLGSFLLETGAATWLSEQTFGALGIASMPILATIAIVSLFNIIIHLGFASATSLASALIPVFIALAATLDVPNGGIGFVVIQQFVICFGFLLPISAPQNMLAYGTGAFTTRQFLKTGIPLTIAGYLLVLLLSATYWQWIGLL